MNSLMELQTFFPIQPRFQPISSILWYNPRICSSSRSLLKSNNWPISSFMLTVPATVRGVCKQCSSIYIYVGSNSPLYVVRWCFWQVYTQQPSADCRISDKALCHPRLMSVVINTLYAVKYRQFATTWATQYWHFSSHLSGVKMLQG